MQRSLLLLLSLLLVLGGCRQQDPTTGTTTVSGQVVENQTRQLVPNATVQVYLASTYNRLQINAFYLIMQ